MSTLLLLISAWVNENWKDIYRYALENDFRFLSYGDCTLLFRKDNDFGEKDCGLVWKKNF
jgi:S-adenosylmethionine:tRNA ribosyltransferase-isomerase